jgi:hypothetical protein
MSLSAHCGHYWIKGYIQYDHAVLFTYDTDIDVPQLPTHNFILKQQSQPQLPAILLDILSIVLPASDSSEESWLLIPFQVQAKLGPERENACVASEAADLDTGHIVACTASE